MAVKEVEHLTSIIRVKVNVKSSISGGGAAAVQSSRSSGGGAAAERGSSEMSGYRACGVAYTSYRGACADKDKKGEDQKQANVELSSLH